MEELFTITVLHNGIEKKLSGRLRISAYTYQFLFNTGNEEIILEKDNEGNFRALSSGTGQKTDSSLIRALIAEMEKIMKD